MMGNWLPRELRRKNTGGKDKQKQLAFKRAAKASKRFIGLSADALAKPQNRVPYAEWCAACDSDSLRRAAK